MMTMMVIIIIIFIIITTTTIIITPVAHRLDRLTSGLVILCKTEQKTKELMNDIKNRNVRKVYLSKVEGIFPKLVA